MAQNEQHEQEMSNVLLMKIQQYVLLFDTYRIKINDIYAKYPTYRHIPIHTLDCMLYLFLPSHRWNNLVKAIFPDMEPPVVKNQTTGQYSYYFIKVQNMTPEQRYRITKLGNNMMPAIWPLLAYVEKVYVCSAAFGMYNNMRSMTHYLNNNHVERQENAMLRDKNIQTTHQQDEEVEQQIHVSKRAKR